MRVTLNQCERKLAEMLSEGRFRGNRESGVANSRVGPQSDKETDLEGISGEIAFSKLFNIYPDMNTNERSDYDAVIMGERIDVKTTKYPNGRLLVRKEKKDHPADWYALMVGQFPVYELVGFAKSEAVFQRENLMDLGHGMSYGVSGKSLYMPKTFMLALKVKL